jgi:hypothetical protein
MTLEEFRLTLVERLRRCNDTSRAREVLVEAELVLRNVRLTDLTYERFWEALEEDLDGLAEEAKFASDRTAGAKLDSVVAAARARIARYRERRTRGSDKGGENS